MIALIDYGMGNLGSVGKALEFVGAEFELLDNPKRLETFSACILPGVGHFGDGMANLVKRGFVAPLREFAASGKVFGGICLGMQMMLDSSEEAPGVAGLGIIPGRVVRFVSDTEKIPHMGWNNVKVKNPCYGTAGIGEEDFFYFVHSFYALPDNPADVALETHYICDFASALTRGNIFATQFHPEKSQQPGLRMLKNIVDHAKN